MHFLVSELYIYQNARCKNKKMYYLSFKQAYIRIKNVICSKNQNVSASNVSE